MNRFLSLAFLLCLQYSVSAKNYFADQQNFDQTVKDTTKPAGLIPVNPVEDQAIDEVLKSRSLPKPEKVQYFSQVTKYGFKNLFKNYSYNPSMPYNSQVNPHAETYMQDYLRSHTSSLQKMKTSALPYFNFIDNILAQYGLPKELKYLAVIESNLNPNATSWVGARGPWQFMSYTAKDYGLQVNGFVDDRTDYYKSTHAAARYLLSLYKDLKDWLLVIAAYNGGPGRVYSAIRQSGSRNFWALQYYLPEESRNHVKKFIATHYIMESGNDAGISTVSNFDYNSINGAGGSPFSTKANLSDEDVNNTDVLTISGKYNAVVITKNISLDILEFNRLNPGFDAMMASGENYEMRLPHAKMDLFVANKYIILNECVHALLSGVSTDTKTVYPSRKLDFKRKK
ncbi:MAG: lytic transglycosylase domain-containing protein [Chitinophagaceae bacterium]|nr:lytic transglycosylase domain-containing protein [Chitinophagaceae bacterium]